MAHVISVEQAAARLSEIIHSLGSGEEIVLTENDAPVARLRSSGENRGRHPGNCKGLLKVVSEDEGHLSDFKAYMS
ncbi:MAG: hypothetical protein HKL96_05935 [Phycisphaerales bacterium]|nr:hypothetical protein [Phycisphaerales bacterium]